MTLLEKAAYKPIEILIPYLGYGEKDSNSGLNNMDTYGHKNYTFIAQYFDDLWNSGYKFYNGRKQGNEWCDMTVDFSMCKAFGPENARKVLYQPMESCGAGCYWSAKYFKENGAWIERSGEPRTGDQIFFGPKGDESHTGIVEKVDSSYVYTIEGNTSDKLMRRTYARTNSNIAGYGRPRYEAVTYMFEEEEDMTKEQTLALIKAELAKIQNPEPTKDSIANLLGDKYIKKFDELPNWAKKEFREILDKKYVDGGTDYDKDPDDINMYLSDVKSIIVANRIIKDCLKEGAVPVNEDAVINKTFAELADLLAEKVRAEAEADESEE